jgi:peroxiredoxin
MRARHPGVRSHVRRLVATGAAASMLLLVAGCGKSGSSTDAAGDGASTGVDVTSSSAPVTSSSAAAAGQTPGLTPAKGSKAAPQAAASTKTSGQVTSAGTQGGTTGGSSTGGAASAAPASAAQPAPQGIVVNRKCRKPASSVGSGVALKGQRPPGFKATTADCGTLDFAPYTDGHPTLVTFYASWCEPCHKEAKDVEAMYEKYRDTKGFHVVGVESQDQDGDPTWFYKNAGWTFPSAWDDGDKIEHAWNQASGAISTLPASFWIHPDGTISSIVVGEMSRSQMEDEFNKL